MLVQLGELTFEVVGPLTRIETDRAYNYAAHPVIGAKPPLQATGDELEQLRLSLAMHTRYCNPTEQLRRLRAAAAAHTALPLVFASGEVRGRFVIAAISDVTEDTDPTGVVTRATARVTLVEWVEGEVPEFKPPKAPPAVRSRTGTEHVTRARKTQPTPPPEQDYHTVPPETVCRMPNSI